MDDKAIIRRFITKNYDIEFTNTVVIKDKYGRGELSGVFTLISETSDVFNTNTTDICNDWFNKKVKQMTNELQVYLSHYRVRLGLTNWEVIDEGGNLFQITDMVKKFEDKYSEKFIRAIYNDWKINLINIKSEELIRNAGKIKIN